MSESKLVEYSGVWGKIFHGDSKEILETFDENWIDALVCDPPAGINFMNMDFDSDRGGREKWITWLEEIMVRALRTLKPGGHGLVWSIPQTSHWTASALENAGFEIRDVIVHHFGSGMATGKNISKELGRIIGEERAVELGEWHSKLKTSTEFWYLVRKPLSERTIIENVMTWGVGGLNIHKSRIKGVESNWKETDGEHRTGTKNGRFPTGCLLTHTPDCKKLGTKKVKTLKGNPGSEARRKDNPTVRLHSKNIRSTVEYRSTDGYEEVDNWECLEDCPVRILGDQSGECKSGSGNKNSIREHKEEHLFKVTREYSEPSIGGDIGTASRYFKQFEPDYDVPFLYCAKASPKDRNMGMNGDHNHHPTVKSTKLMSYLVNLITPPGGIILDCFMGAGSTGISAIHNNFYFIGIELEEVYFEIARKRIENIRKFSQGRLSLTRKVPIPKRAGEEDLGFTEVKRNIFKIQKEREVKHSNLGRVAIPTKQKKRLLNQKRTPKRSNGIEHED